MNALLISAGLALLFLGGEGLLRGSVALAARFGLSTLLVSMVVVGFGTSAPELLVTTTAAMKGAPDIALGNVVGSNIANVLLILGIAACIAPVSSGRLEILRDSMAVLVASVVLVALSVYGEIGRPAGLTMLAALIAYMSYAYLIDKRKAENDLAFRSRLREDVGNVSLPLWRSLTYCALGIAALAVGANLLVTGATSIARQMGISEAVIGLTMIAVGTSLPELATALVAAYRRHPNVVLGNVIGSNLFNTLGILGVASAIVPLPITGRIADTDVWIMLVVAVAVSPILWTGRVISRVEGAMFLALYLVYMFWVWTVGSP